MIVRIVLVLFVSGASAVCYLAGYTRLMSALLIGFGTVISLFFGLLFVVPEGSRELWLPVYGGGSAWPFFLLAAILAGIVALLFSKREEFPDKEIISSDHLQYLIGGFFAYILSIFLAALLWFPSDEKRLSLDSAALEIQVFLGTCLYLAGTLVALYLFYKASKGMAENYPDLMRRVVLALFSCLHFDKIPAFIAFLLIYSPETGIIYPSIAALALSAYLPVSLFLLKMSWQSEKVQ